MTIMTRQEYIGSDLSDRATARALHRRYYAQFVDEHTIAHVAMYFGGERLRSSTDEHLNDIPLIDWDHCAANMPRAMGFTVAGDYATKAGLVCVAKEAARQWIEAQHVKVIHITGPEATRFFEGYDANCAAATTHQGLYPTVAALTGAGIDHYVWQSGGFTMIVCVRLPDDTEAWITNYGEPDGPVCVTHRHICHRDDFDDELECAPCFRDGDLVHVDELAAFISDLKEGSCPAS